MLIKNFTKDFTSETFLVGLEIVYGRYQC
jgi:hypothetical protein